MCMIMDEVHIKQAWLLISILVCHVVIISSEIVCMCVCVHACLKLP